ncbi:MAG: hypothetical protein HY559_04915 [Gammaproteobacteria bacterium]|nr:hypothetical protein [Gammaproteobacteria bacterium]
MLTLAQIQEALDRQCKCIVTRKRGPLDTYCSICLYACLQEVEVTELTVIFVESNFQKIPKEVDGLDFRVGIQERNTSFFEVLLMGIKNPPCPTEFRLQLMPLAIHLSFLKQNIVPCEIQEGHLAEIWRRLQRTGRTDAFLLGWLDPVLRAHAKNGMPPIQSALLDELLVELLKERFQKIKSLKGIANPAGALCSQFEQLVRTLPPQQGSKALSNFAQYVTLQTTGDVENNAYIRTFLPGLLGTQVLLLEKMGWDRKQLALWLAPVLNTYLKR